MAINVNTPFRRTGPNPIDDSITLTKAEMLAVNDDMMPDVYFAVCKDDGNLYTYSKTATPSTETGKFKLVEGGGGGGSVPAKTYTMDWDEANKELELNDGTITQSLPLTGLQSELTAGTNITIENNVISATGGSGDPIQVTTLPTASATEEGKIYQYIGATNADYTNGYFYECVEITPATDPKTYEWVRKNVQPASGGSVPAGGTTDQILAKISDTDGDADWVDDTGKILTKLDYLYGYDESGVPTKTVTAVSHPMGQNMLCIYKNDLFSNFEEFIQAYLAGKFDVVINDFVPAGGTTPVSITLPRNKASRYQDIWLELQWVDRTDGIAIPGSSRKLDVFSLAYIDGAQYQYNDTIVVSPRCSYFPNYTTNRVSCSVTLNALGDNSFTPYERIPKYIHNLTGRVLTDLKISGKAIPTDWGVAKAGRLTFTFASASINDVTATIDISELGITSANDYEVLLTMTGGGTMDWGSGDIFAYEKTTTQIGVTYRNTTSSIKDSAIADYVIVAKGFGNNSMSGSGSSLPTGGTTGQMLVKKSDADGDVEWKDLSTKIDTLWSSDTTPSGVQTLTHPITDYDIISVELRWNRGSYTADENVRDTITLVAKDIQFGPTVEYFNGSASGTVVKLFRFNDATHWQEVTGEPIFFPTKFVGIKFGAETGGGRIEVDSALSDTSENPVQNKVITAAIGNIETILTTLTTGNGV